MNIYYTNFEKKSQLNFTSISKLSYFVSALAKSKAEPQNSNNEHMAHNTPLNACFFMRSIRAPKIQLTPMVEVAKQHLAAQTKQLTSMVTCSGKGFALCCVPYVAVSEPVTRYRPSLRTLAVTSKDFTYGVTDMLYRFKAVSRLDLRQTNKPISSFPRYTVRINADTIKQATTKVSPFFVILEVQHG
ncbi:ash family protein [Gallibacterium genomosp. 3]|uniref:ash family protein n=1 Tax=Gallibacterium genomosp. 3 TaxID=505345 RepID=UPI000802839E|nr:ash family protein [Gallibacterium genomosp. 3]